VNAALQDVVKLELDSLGYDLVVLREGGTRARRTVEVRIDRRDGRRVSIADCVRASRALEARLDAEGVGSEEGAPSVRQRYELQVSSPGTRESE
jgi:ribosome maturation factor RimP